MDEGLLCGEKTLDHSCEGQRTVEITHHPPHRWNLLKALLNRVELVDEKGALNRMTFEEFKVHHPIKVQYKRNMT